MQYRVGIARDIRADVVPLAPTAWGTFVKSTAAGSFPDLGGGLWVLYSTTNIVFNRFTAGFGNSGDAGPFEGRIMTFVSDVTPQYNASSGTPTIAYRFYRMGSWV